MEMNLNKGIQIINDTIALLEDKADFAYFFVVGAGISVPEIPTASQIVEICKEKVKERGEDAYQLALSYSAPYALNPSLDYSSWIENAFPNPINRSQFYKNLIKNAKISSANLMLAQILQSKSLANTVFTTNFDDKIEQALDIIGSKDVFSSENKADNLVVSVNSDEIQIVHVHGTYRFYDIANLSTEISDVSGQNEMVSSSQLLKNFLQQKAPIVLGYSGWENDVIMKSIKERLSYPVPYKYIWICFSRSDYESLPSWLKDNKNVCFVLPPDGTNQCDESEKDIESIFDQNKCPNDSEIPATLFLGKLIGQLKIAPPQIFLNPYAYFSSMVESTLPGNEDVLHLRHWAQRMKYHAQNETQFEAKFNEIEIALVAKNFEQICEILTDFSNMELQTQDLRFLSKCISTELLEDKYLIKIASSKVELLLSILSFIESNARLLPKIEELGRLLYSIVFVRFKHSERSDYINVLDKVIDLTKECQTSALLDTHLSAIGMKSTISDNNDEKLELLDELLDKIPAEASNRMLRHYELVALLFKCELVNEDEASDLLAKAEKIYHEYSLDNHELLLLRTKAELASRTKNADSSILLAKECLEAIPKYYSEEYKLDVIKIVFFISQIPSEQLLQIDQIENIITSTLDIINTCEYKIQNCECTIMVADTYLRLIEITSSPKSKLRYCENIFSLSDNFPHDCGKYCFTSFLAHSCICSLPTVIVPDEVKVTHLQMMKDTTAKKPNLRRLYLATIAEAIEVGEENIYYTSFEEDIKILRLMESLEAAADKYANKQFAEAEQMFQKLVKSDDVEVKDSALNNLAFMARRGDIVDNTLTFEKLIKGVSDQNIFKHMNLLLRYLQVDHFDFNKCKKAYAAIRCADSEDIQSLIRCWGNETLVGNEESLIGMAIINSIRSKDVCEISKSLPVTKYNLDALKTISTLQDT